MFSRILLLAGMRRERNFEDEKSNNYLRILFPKNQERD
jgi:hypothetical protein